MSTDTVPRPAGVQRRSTGVDLAKWAVVARKDNTGFGRCAADVRRVLGLGHHFVCPSDRIEGRPPEGGDESWLPPDISDDELAALLGTVKGIVFFETYGTWHPSLLKVARAVGVKTVCIPTWEWFRGDDPTWALCDLFACPTRFTVNVVAGFGWRQARYLPWTLDLGRFPARTIKGPARVFIHNAGLVDRDDRKGTRDAIRAFKRVKRDDLRLIVRMQNDVPLPPLDGRIEVRIGDLEDPKDLYASGDVAIQPSKMEGIGFMVIEAVASGMPVLAINYPPMNEFVRQPEMLTRLRWFKRRAYANNWVKQSHLRLPRISDLARQIQWCAENEMAPFSAANRRFAEATFDPVTLRREWTACLGAL
jgi:glycosyltransferase involved in cell wall biosynthesis